METTKYSVVIPVYNSEKTLRRCVNSLLSQPHDSAEILLINDGSTDESGALCQEYERTNTCIRYIEKKNGGVASARNCGIDHANGRYLLFVDSDDYVTPDFFSSIDAVQLEFDYDLIQFSNYFTDGIDQTKRIRKLFRATSREKLFPKIIESFYRKKSNAPWAKVYSRSIIESKNIRFPENMEVGEDRAFYIHYSLYMNSFCVSNHPIYVVNTENDDSLSRKIRDDLDEQTMRLNAYIDDALQRSGVSDKELRKYQETLNYDILRMVYAKAKTLRRNNNARFFRLRALRGYCHDLNQLHLVYPNTFYCLISSIPVRWNLALVIDLMAWKLIR